MGEIWLSGGHGGGGGRWNRVCTLNHSTTEQERLHNPIGYSFARKYNGGASDQQENGSAQN